MKKLLSLAALLILLTSCGSKEAEKPIILEDTLRCFHDVCSNQRMSCRKINYYSNELKCVLVLSEKDLDDIKEAQGE